MGMWPCGVITLLRELFLAESKAQVYGHLHQFLQSAPATASNLGMCLYIPAVGETTTSIFIVLLICTAFDAVHDLLFYIQSMFAMMTVVTLPSMQPILADET